MPSAYSNSPFLSLRPDHDCGRSKSPASPSTPSKSFASLSTPATSITNGNGYSHTNGHANGHLNINSTPDEFLKLDKPQQDLLLLHGPRQKYSLEKSKDIPALEGEREILIQVLAIGLNPVDWKGADYGFSQPSYPWVNGRDFAGIVVRAPRDSSRIQQGDVVFGPSTDYRDVRKAAYQEYVVTTDYNVTRIPSGVSVKEGAALGVAYVAALVALGISFGVDFSSLRNAPAGPDLLHMARQLDPREVPEDIRDEIFSGIPNSERPQPGEWIAIWGANSMTGQVALQLAKQAGLKVACIADVARGGARLSELGADFMVDRYDDKRAVDIIKAVTGGKLRFGIDCNGKDSAASLEQALQQSETGLKSHLLGLTGLPKAAARGVVHHKVPIKLFHEAPHIGEAMSTWLEDLLVARTLKLPEVEIAEGGLAGINDALDRMRKGLINGKRIVVPVGENKSGATSPAPNGIVPNGISSVVDESHDLSYADSLNSDPDRVRFAYWVPNVSGGLVISKIKQRTNWDLKANVRYARTAEAVGFEYALSQIRFMAGYGAENQHEPVSFSQALLMATERLKVIAALLPGPWNPAVAAKQIASIDNYCDGRVCVNVVSGWFRAEFASIGQWWLDHAERYRRSREFIECLKGIWTNEKFSYKGDFYQFHDYPLKPKPLNLPGRPYPEIFQGGNSDDAKGNAATVSDYYFMNGNTLEGFQGQIADVKERAKKNNREGQVGFALNAFVICRESEEEAIRVLQEIQGKADAEAVEGFRQQVQNAGSSTGNKSGMWANSKFEDLVQYNDGFKTKLIGTKEQIAERIVLLKSLGVNIILTAFLHYDEEIEQFGREVIPLVRELEKSGRGTNEAREIELNGDVYRKNPQSSDKEEQSKVSVVSEKTTSTSSAPLKKWAPRWTSAGWVDQHEQQDAKEPSTFSAEPQHTTNPTPSQPMSKWTPAGFTNEPEPQRSEAEKPSVKDQIKDKVQALPGPKEVAKTIVDKVTPPNEEQRSAKDDNTTTSAGDGNVPNQWDEPPPPEDLKLLPTKQSTAPVQWDEPSDTEALPVKPERKPLVFTAGDLDGRVGGENEEVSAASKEISTAPVQWEDAPKGPLDAGSSGRVDRRPLVFTAGDTVGTLGEPVSAPQEVKGGTERTPAENAELPQTEVAGNTTTSTTEHHTRDTAKTANAAAAQQRPSTASKAQVAPSKTEETKTETKRDSTVATPRPSTATSGRLRLGKEGSVKGRGVFSKIRHSLKKDSGKE
ncbi:hypothetical protein PRZ48_005490 [Zasmidium cellare]|uniref:Enoyl reductase (ER) domain-containing protein n=1 Tax=Zasmidium cellare TaxID=395010 RepID=A0ABR0ESH4_ZASCE|nr:hypothetical protein PRZ48_005490 [Zasmidium cellare]